jgi:hypothetical protein
MAEALTTATKLVVVGEIQEDESGAMLRFQQGVHGRLAVGDPELRESFAARPAESGFSQQFKRLVGVTSGRFRTPARIA